VVHVHGQIDLQNFDAVRADVLAAVPLDGPGMVLDLTQVTYVESSGVRLFFEVAEHLQARRQRLVLVVAQEALMRRVVALTKLDNVVPIVATIDEALTFLQNV
jgi:anti-sigma B factor antagonist/stage II sporulation protein AA (anti-sigma F factor antagonist)